ncbi:hypothetical protein ABNF65_21095 [Paenibacillus larvae]
MNQLEEQKVSGHEDMYSIEEMVNRALENKKEVIEIVVKQKAANQIAAFCKENCVHQTIHYYEEQKQLNEKEIREDIHDVFVFEYLNRECLEKTKNRREKFLLKWGFTI